MSYNEDYCHEHIIKPISTYQCPQCEIENLLSSEKALRDQIDKLQIILQQIQLIMNGEPDATLKLSVEGETSIEFHKTMTLTTAEFACYLVSKS